MWACRQKGYRGPVPPICHGREATKSLLARPLNQIGQDRGLDFTTCSTNNAIGTADIANVELRHPLWDNIGRLCRGDAAVKQQRQICSIHQTLRHKLQYMDQRPGLTMLCGLPGSGKTTVAKQRAASVPAVRLCPDEWITDLEVNVWDDDFRNRLEARFWRLTQELLTLGQNVILESGFWLRSDRDEKRHGAQALDATV